MSAADNKKAKRRKYKKGTVSKTTPTGNVPNTSPTQGTILSPSVDSETLKKLEKLMDAKEEKDMPLLSLSRGPNPYLPMNRERCLLCGCERQDPPQAADIKAESESGEKKNGEAISLSQLPLWVCPACRKSADREMEKKPPTDSFLDHACSDLSPDSASLPFLPELNLGGSEPTTPNGSVCTCEACTERREIEAEHDLETQELQKCWTELRKMVRTLYNPQEEDNEPEGVEEESSCNEEGVKELVHRLCTRDAHQLFLRLESQVREFVIEMKVKLLKQLNIGFKTPPEARQFISMLLEEYGHLCRVARKMAGVLKELESEHLKKFKVTWELHNKHLFQSIAYTEPQVQNSLRTIIDQLRLGAASKESYNEDTYPNLLHRYLKFDDEMSVISVVWRDCHQLIESYNEEQAALKLKQKMLKEDWEFFKAQRKILEQQVPRNSKSPSHSLDVQFTETMRLMLQGTKPSVEECHCPRCNRKRCPCDECTITHMITCGIINPEVLESHNTSNNINFLHDPNRYRIDVSPPSMSSTTSSSGSSSPIMVDPERLTLPFDECPGQYENGEEIQEEIEGSQSEDDEEEDEEEECDEGEDEEEEDEEEDEDDDEDDEDEEDEEEDEEEEEEDEECDAPEGDDSSEPQAQDGAILTDQITGWTEEQVLADKLELDKQLGTCDCHHCISQAKVEQMRKAEDSQCQCHVCLQQQGKSVSTSLPQHVPPVMPRPGELHLYPHIHGLGNRGHVRPLLQPQLYDLHVPLRQQQQKPIIQTKVPMKLDFDSPDGIHDHFYHAYGDWDNTYDARMLMNSGPKYGSELLPPPPLPTTYSSNFLTEPFAMAGSPSTSVVTTTTTATSAFRNTVNDQATSTTFPSASNMAATSQDQPVVEPASKTARCSLQTNNNKTHSPPCSRPAPLGGNSVQKPVDKTHSQHCKKHGVPVQGKPPTSAQAHSHAANSLPMKVTPEFIQTAARNIREGAKEGMQMIRQFASSLNANVNTHPCTHNNSRNNANHSYQTSGVVDPHSGTCASSVSLPTTVNNVSVGTSTVCTEPDCDGHHDDNYDSVDDSCSEQSSSTSTSNQKEGKYCDCCYCEFFGHGNPPVAPTSKNYAEMRDRLRLRLKKKTEAKQDDDSHHGDFHLDHNHSHGPKGKESLDELIRFINGPEDMKQEKQLSAKAAKRARQKQRKAEEKSRLEAAEKHQKELELQAKTKKVKKSQVNESSSRTPQGDGGNMESSQQQSASQKKKKGKHKIQASEEAESSAKVDTQKTEQLNKVSHLSVAKENSRNANNSKNENHPPKKRPETPSKPLPQQKTAAPPSANNKDSVTSSKQTNKDNPPPQKQQPKPPQQPTKAQPPQNQQSKVQPPAQRPQQKLQQVVQQQQQQHRVLQQQQNQQQLPSNQQQQDKNRKSKNEPRAGPQNGQPQANLQQHRSSSTPLQNGHVQPKKVINTTQGQNNSAKIGVNNKASEISITPESAKRARKQEPSLGNGKQSIPEQTQASKQRQTAPPPVPQQNGIQSTPKNRPQVTNPGGQNSPRMTETPKNGRRQQDESPANGQEKVKPTSGKNKKNKKKNKSSEDLNFIDEVFMPKSESDLEGGELDDFERELEEFKRFCLDSPPAHREKLQINMNIKDIFVKKKSGLSCN